jgi:hypothetical protein
MSSFYHIQGQLYLSTCYCKSSEGIYMLRVLRPIHYYMLRPQDCNHVVAICLHLNSVCQFLTTVTHELLLTSVFTNLLTQVRIWSSATYLHHSSNRKAQNATVIFYRSKKLRCDGLITHPEESYHVSVCMWSRTPEKGGQRSVLDYKRLWMNGLITQSQYGTRAGTSKYE